MNTIRAHADDLSPGLFSDISDFVESSEAGETPDLFAALGPLPKTRSAKSGQKSLARRPNERADRADCDERGNRKAAAQSRDATTVSAKPLVARKSVEKTAYVDHLAATRKLHWKLRRAKSHSPEEVKAGRLICRHLLAMLNEELNEQGSSRPANSEPSETGSAEAANTRHPAPLHA